MRSKLLTLAATGVVALALGAGVGVAAAQSGGGDSEPPATVPAGDYGSMDEMHAAMRDVMPAEFAAQCDAMHDSMPESIGSLDPGSMMGSGTGGFMAGVHAQHHG